MSAASTDEARRVIDQAIVARVFPAASIEIGSSAGVTWREAFGTLTFDVPTPTTVDMPFDLASMTKVVVTTSVVMDLVRTGALRLEEPLSSSVAGWTGADRAAVTVRDLLEHASGLPARLPGPPPQGRDAFAQAICTTRLEYAPRTRSIYSDLDFILLGFVAEDRGGAPLQEQFARLGDVASGVGIASCRDVASGFSRTGAAPTMPLADDPRAGRLLVGEVHDNYAAALGGFAGHAGLFGSAPCVGAFARIVLRAARGDRSGPEPFTPARVAAFTTKSSVPGSSRALGWDTMLPTSSCGTRMSASAFGHPGFTGTSLWIDPDRDRYYVLLTNRACGGGTADQMRGVRRAFHDATAGA